MANTAALTAAGIDRKTASPPEGLIEKDAEGIPTGAPREMAINLVRDAMPEKDDATVYADMKSGSPLMHAMGLTGLHDVRLMGDAKGPQDMRIWQRLHREGDLHLRCWASIPGERIDEAVALGLTSGFGNDRLRVGW